MSLLTGVPLAQLAEETWEVLRTYEQAVVDLKRNSAKEGPTDDGHAAFLQHAQRYGE